MMRFRVNPFKVAEYVLHTKSKMKGIWKPVLFVCIMLFEGRHSFLPAPKLVMHDGMWLGKIPGLENSGHAHFEGETRGGRMQGVGRLTLTDGTKYEGNFSRDQIIGNGRIKYPDGSEYVGPIRRWKQYGVGKLMLPDGNVVATNTNQKSPQVSM